MRLLLGLATALVLTAATPATAQKLDLAKVTCQQFLESGKENIGFVLMWLHGYWTEEDDPPVVDFDKMGSDAEKIGAYCGKNPAKGFMEAAEAVLQ
jgi:acid stress chaperone HdeB